ncbi:hypothetical protein [Deinococcus grandis]|nr:hypothetical protein [Deinococcus grandis]
MNGVVQAAARFNTRDNIAHPVRMGDVSTPENSRAGRLDDLL